MELSQIKYNTIFVVGKEEHSIKFISSCNCLDFDSVRGLRLKQKHAYYGQVQLGMALLSLPECDFVLYSPKSKTFLNIIVPFDEEFARMMIEKITCNYFNHMIHVICSYNEENY